ncbi:phycobiliprotein lyase [Vulcanococcus sp. Clear-D1]|uniref:phycobiliprotein lyase n=1 Tax=Vulcanococcus sp. Clear-D1 TaxID=2766970 RepID=UPI0019C4CC00|nr:phycobiliprotein lyase [Vulcanococcus sp. Clear-D1]MBD1192826.1 phycobiliprotein lyase [Vulcanococcus sp. Clear-D1]
MSLSLENALSFFQLSCGRWRSQRSVHHLLHRRAEAGGSLIVVDELAASDSRLLELAELHGQDPAGLVGGCWVRWSASMAWDKAGEDHTGESVIGLIPTDDRGREGILLRDLGYAEKAPASSRFCMDEHDGLLLSTEYETMSVWERFAFQGPNVRVRSSTVEGLSNNASFCIETRCDDAQQERPAASAAAGRAAASEPALSLLGW